MLAAGVAAAIAAAATAATATAFTQTRSVSRQRILHSVIPKTNLHGLKGANPLRLVPVWLKSQGEI